MPQAARPRASLEEMWRAVLNDFLFHSSLSSRALGSSAFLNDLETNLKWRLCSMGAEVLASRRIGAPKSRSGCKTCK
jgi:hypothetical protein